MLKDKVRNFGGIGGAVMTTKVEGVSYIVRFVYEVPLRTKPAKVLWRAETAA